MWARVGDGAIDGFGGEVAEGEHLVFGEAGGAELLVGAVEEMLRGGMGAVPAASSVMAGAKLSIMRRWIVAAALPWSC